MKAILVTGSNGGIGTAICSELAGFGYHVIGTDCSEDINQLNAFIKFDLQDLSTDEDARNYFCDQLVKALSGRSLFGLVNNAAIQILAGIENIDINDFQKTININLTAPLILSKLCFPYLKESRGSIVNIGSIHAKLTKPAFISYATSKSALLGLTQALAVDMGEFVRVNIIQPAATETDMLVNGFAESPSKLESIKQYHPTRTIASTGEISKVVSFLLSSEITFMNGAAIDVNGGIGYRLHDPV